MTNSPIEDCIESPIALLDPGDPDPLPDPPLDVGAGPIAAAELEAKPVDELVKTVIYRISK